MKSYKDLGNRYIIHRKKRAVLVTLSMVLATILIYIVTTLALNYWFDSKAMVFEQMNYHGCIPNLNAEQCEKIEDYATVRNADFISLDEEQEFQDFYGRSLLQIYYMEDVNQTTYNFKVVEGRLPKDSTEILLDKKSIHLFKGEVKVGSTVKTIKYTEVYPEEIPEGWDKYDITPEIIEEEFTYTVAGIYEYECYNEFAYGNIAFSVATDDMVMEAYVRFDTDVDWESYTETLAKDVGVDTSKNNTYAKNDMMEMFYFKGDSISYVALFLMLMVFVVYISMVMVRGLFTANLMDNITEFSILKAMGATDKKIKAIYKREIYLEGLVAFGIGVILSHILLAALDKVINIYGWNFAFSTWALLFGFGFMYITITLAIIEPFSILKKIPIVEGIRANYAVNTMKDKKRAGKLFRIFGIEGEYAYKNMRRNSKSFWNGVASFTVSVLVLTVLVAFIANLKVALGKSSGDGKTKDLYDYYTYMISGDEERVTKAQSAFENQDFIKSADPIYVYTSMGDFNVESLRFTEDTKAILDEYLWTSEDIVTYYYLTDEQLEKLNAYMMDGVDANVIRDGGAILLNSFTYYDDKSQEEKTITVHEKNIGDTILLETMDYVVKKNKVWGDAEAIKALEAKGIPTEEVKIEGFCSRDFLNYHPIVVFLSYDYYAERTDVDLNFLCQGFYLDIDESEWEITDLIALERTIYEETAQLEYEYINLAKWMDEQTRSGRIIVICIVAFVILMGIVSILNNMVNEMQVRRKEVSILRAVGMSKKKLNRMLILERVIMGLIAWIIGTVLGLALSSTMLISILYLMETSMIIPWIPCLLIGAGVIGIMVLLSMGMVISLGKMDITEGIRNQE